MVQKGGYATGWLCQYTESDLNWSHSLLENIVTVMVSYKKPTGVWQCKEAIWSLHGKFKGKVHSHEFRYKNKV